MKEALVGAVAGASAGDTVAEKTYGTQKSEATIMVRNPYDGTITEIEVQRTGFDANIFGVLGESVAEQIDPNKVYEISDLPRLLPESSRLNVDAQLAESARKRRKKIEEDEARHRASVFRDSLLSRNRESSSGNSLSNSTNTNSTSSTSTRLGTSRSSSTSSGSASGSGSNSRGR